MRFAFRITLAIVNMIVLLFLFFYIPASTLVLIACLPAIIYSIYSKKLFLSLFVIISFAVLLAIGLLGFCYGAGNLAHNVGILFYVYTQIYPYSLSVNLVGILTVPVLFWTGALLIVILIATKFWRFTELHATLSFSYLILAFSTFYVLMNIFLYFLVPLRILIMEFIFTRVIIGAFYVWLPFLILNLMLITSEGYLIGGSSKGKMEKENKKMKNYKNKWLKKAVIWGVFCILIIALVLFILVVMQV